MKEVFSYNYIGKGRLRFVKYSEGISRVENEFINISRHFWGVFRKNKLENRFWRFKSLDLDFSVNRGNWKQFSKQQVVYHSKLPITS
jgi:hypothetical protein